MKDQLQLFKQRRYTPLFIAQFTGAFNDNFFKQAAIFLLTYGAIVASQQSSYWINIASTLFIAPFFIFSALGGELADKYEKTTILRITKAFEVLLAIFISFALYHQSLSAILTAIFMFGLHSTLFGPAKYAILPELLEEDELIAGNAFLESSTFVAILVGMAGSYIVTHEHYGIFLTVSILLTTSVAGFIGAMMIPNTGITYPDTTVNLNLISSTFKVILKSTKNQTVWLSILGISWFFLLGYVIVMQFPVFVRDYLHGSSIVVSMCMTLFTVGFVAGALLCNSLLQDRVKVTFVPIAVFGLSIFLIDLYFASSNVAIVGNIHQVNSLDASRFAFDLLMIAFCGGLFTVPLYTVLQTKPEPSERSQMIGSCNIMNALFMMLGSVLVYLLNLINFQIPQVFLLLGMVNLGITIVICGVIPKVLIKALFKTCLKLFYKVEVHDMHNYPKDENFIVIANHTSYLDILLICTFLPDTFTIAANTEISKKWWIRPFLYLAETFPVDPTNPMATRAIIERVRKGAKCVIFPEGRLTTTGALMKIYEGPGLIAEKGNAKVLPIRIDGAQQAFPFSRLTDKMKMHLFPKITVTLLPPISLTPSEKARNSRERRRQYSIRLYRLMREMMFTASRYQNTLYEALLSGRDVYGSTFAVAEDMERKPIQYRQFILKTIILGRHIKKTTHFAERVGIMLPTTITAMINFFALQLIARVPAMINFTTGARNIIHGCNTCGIRKIYTSRKFVAAIKLEKIIEELQSNNLEIIYLEDLREKITSLKKILGVLTYLRISAYHNRFAKKMRPEDPATILFTSGSEGNPKSVALSHANLLANCYQMRASIDFNQKDTVFNTLPVFHSFGLTVGSILPLISGIKVFFYPSPLHYRVVPELIYDCNATLLFGTDTFLSGYARYAHNYDFYSIRYVFAGAEKLKPETYRIWTEKFGVRIFEGYGATEAAPVLSCNTPMENKLGTVGRLMPGLNYRLEPVEGLDQSNAGRLFVKGPNVMIGYFADENTMNRPENGWYDTGDIVEIDHDGFIKICDRAKRFAKIGGEMVSLTAVEHAVSEIWPGHMHACGRIPDPKKGEQVVLLSTQDEAKFSTLVSSMRKAGYAEIFIPKRVLHVAEIPLLGSGKINYTEVTKVINDLVLSKKTA